MLTSFFRYYLGFLTQVLPFTALVIYPLASADQMKKKRIYAMFFSLIQAESVVFTLLCIYISNVMPPGAAQLNIANIFFFLCLIPQGSCYFRVFTCPDSEKIFLLFFGLICGCFTASVVNIANELILKPWIPVHPDSMPYSLPANILLLISGIIISRLGIALLHKFYLPIREMATRREFEYFSSLSVFLFLIIGSGMTFLDFIYFKNPIAVFLFVVLFAAVAVIYIICFLMLKSFQEKLIAQNQLLLLEHNLELNREQYGKISDMLEHSRKIRHDFRHHAIVLKGLIESGKPDDAVRYINRYADSIEEQGAGQYCLHPVINTLISYYASKCQEKEIIFSVKLGKQLAVLEPEQLTVHDADLSVVLGNLLENALTAASESSETASSFIRLNLIHQGSALVIAIDNSFAGERKLTGNQYQSTKENHTGVGLSSVCAVAEKYDGGAEFSHEDGVFHASVMLPLPEENDPSSV